jgi:SAM-dependent methyltransferase
LDHVTLFVKKRFPILRCSECQLVSTRTAAGFDARAIYTARYFEGGSPDSYVDYEGSERVLRADFRRLVDVIRRAKPQGRLLEIGCAYGFFLDEAAAYYDVHGVEVCHAAALRCRAKGHRVFEGHVSDVGLPDKSLDVAVLLDCIEHLTDPVATLRTVHRLLKPGGFLIMTTGNVASPLARLTGRWWRLMTPPQHLFFFSPPTVRLLLDKTGFEGVAISHPGKRVPLGLMAYQVGARVGLRVRWLERATRVGLRVNLFDAMRITARTGRA